MDGDHHQAIDGRSWHDKSLTIFV